MFIGEYYHTLDEKGRIAIPKKFRSQFEQGAVVTRGLDTCLFLFPLKEWEQLAEKLSKLPLSKSNSRAFSRLMLAGAMDVELDGQGRVMIPEYLRSYAQVGKSVVVAGLYNRLELWDQTKWNEYKKETEHSSGNIAEAMGELGV